MRGEGRKAVRGGYKPMWRFVTSNSVHENSYPCASACHCLLELHPFETLSKHCLQERRCTTELHIRGMVSKSSWAVAHLIVGLCLADTCRQSSIKAAMFWGASSGTFKGRNWPLMQISQSSTPAEDAVGLDLVQYQFVTLLERHPP